ncbi:MAG: GNAT family N-acetyltransferase [Sphingopyxis sp.]|nr:GNAT family N-acetyltransferase [Sphingopyxis sp.]
MHFVVIGYPILVYSIEEFQIRRYVLKMTENLTFRPLKNDDLYLLCEWLNMPHMRHFYQKTPIDLDEVEQKFGPRIEGKTPTFDHIVMHSGVAIGKMQSYKIMDYPDFAKDIDVNDGISVDLFIGNPVKIGVGLGKNMLRSYLSQIAFPEFAAEDFCYICHEIDNHAALACSKSVGFKYLKDVVESGNKCKLLVIDKSSL